MSNSSSTDTIASVAKDYHDRLTQYAGNERKAQAMTTTLKTPEIVTCKSDCEICGGPGLIKYDVDIDHPYFGRLFPCPNLPLESPHYNECGLTISERAYTWKGQLKGRSDKDTNAALHLAVDAVKSVLAAKRGLVTLTGGNGLAKSLILKIAVAETLRSRRGKISRYTHMAEIMEDMRASYDTAEPGRSMREIEKRYARYPVLCIDELGVGRDTDFTEEKQFFLIDRRYTAAIENNEPLITILATNLDIKDFPPRIADRLMDGRCAHIKLVGASMRPALKQDKML